MNPQNIHLLLVDDDEDDFILVREALEEVIGIQYHIDWAQNVEVAHQFLAQDISKYDACLLDYNLGSVTGLDFLKDVHVTCPNLPFILLTGFGDREIDMMAMQHGVSDYLSKTQLEPTLLERTIRYAIERARNLLKLQQYTDELQVKNRELDAYTHTIAHSLRNPLGLFSSFASLIRMADGKKLSPDSLEMLGEIENQAHKLANITSQLLLLSQVRDVSEVITEVDVQPILEAVIKRYDHLIRENKVQVEVSADLPPVMGHAIWVEEIFSNFVSNALKYIGSDNEAPKLIICARHKDNCVIYEVIDNGIGIAAEDNAQLFEMFSRIRTQETDAIEGAGLGLSVVYRLIQKMNGTVGVQSELRKGSTFWFTLPAP